MVRFVGRHRGHLGSAPRCGTAYHRKPQSPSVCSCRPAHSNGVSWSVRGCACRVSFLSKRFYEREPKFYLAREMHGHRDPKFYLETRLHFVGISTIPPETTQRSRFTPNFDLYNYKLFLYIAESTDRLYAKEGRKEAKHRCVGCEVGCCVVLFCLWLRVMTSCHVCIFYYVCVRCTCVVRLALPFCTCSEKLFQSEEYCIICHWPRFAALAHLALRELANECGQLTPWSHDIGNLP